jgi:hypothetical protein
VVKAPRFDLSELTTNMAAPLPEAIQRTASTGIAPPTTTSAKPTPKQAAGDKVVDEVSSANLEGLNFKVTAEFRKRFRRAAADADLKLNELLVEALDAWERAQS